MRLDEPHRPAQDPRDRIRQSDRDQGRKHADASATARIRDRDLQRSSEMLGASVLKAPLGFGGRRRIRTSVGYAGDLAGRLTPYVLSRNARLVLFPLVHGGFALPLDPASFCLALPRPGSEDASAARAPARQTLFLLHDLVTSQRWAQRYVERGAIDVLLVDDILRLLRSPDAIDSLSEQRRQLVHDLT